jgi:ferredoxin-NADP reductase
MAFSKFKKTNLIYKGKKTVGNRVFCFSFESEKDIKWQAGQHCILYLLTSSSKIIKKPFTIVSSPSENTINVATKFSKETNDIFKKTMLKLKPGDQVFLKGPFGSLTVSDLKKDYAFLTTGMGITAFRSILKELTFLGDIETKITLFFVGNRESHYFKEELNDFKSILRNLTIIYIYKPERITGQIIEETMGQDLLNTYYYLSGSHSLVKSNRRTLLGLGVKKDHIKSNPHLKLKDQLKYLFRN